MVKRYRLFGNLTIDFINLPESAITDCVTPLNLTGDYMITGLDYGPIPITLKPHMTIVHLMHAASNAHAVDHRSGHIFFEGVTITNRVIDFDMGS